MSVQTSAIPTLAGECNCCGLCCAGVLDDGRVWRCEYLSVAGTLGQPLATRCMLYRQRYDGMPIRLVLADGETQPGTCTKDSPMETLLILRQLGRGCSLRIAENPALLNVFQRTGGA